MAASPGPSHSPSPGGAGTSGLPAHLLGLSHCVPCPARPRRFATRERNALLLYNGRFNEKHDFLALEVVEEQVQLTFSAGRASSREQRPLPVQAPRVPAPVPCSASGIRPVQESGGTGMPTAVPLTMRKPRLRSPELGTPQRVAHAYV